MNHGDWKALFYSVESNDIQLVQYYLKMGIDINYQHPEFMTSPFFESIRCGHIEIVELFLQNDADLNTIEMESGKKPMDIAIKIGQKDIIEMIKKFLSHKNPNQAHSSVAPEMKATICTMYAPPGVLKIETLATPVPKSGQVLIKIAASSLNSGDVRVRALAVDGWMKWMMRLAVGWSKPRKPILGVSFSGIVAGIESGVSHYKLGDRVYGLTGFNFGCHAEYTTISEKAMIAPMPENMPFQEAAAMLFGGQTAIYFLLKSGIDKLKNPKVLILGETGSVGTSAIQIAKYYNAHVTAVFSSSGAALCSQLGADQLIAYDHEDFTKSNQKYDIILDAVGKYTQKQCRQLLTKHGIYKTVGGMEYASEKPEQLALLTKIYQEGLLTAVIDKHYSLDQIEVAHRYVDTGRKKGNVVINITKL